MPNTALLIKNPLAATHEFKQACQLCHPKTGNLTRAAAPLSALGMLGIPGVWKPGPKVPVHPWEIPLGEQGPPLQERKGWALIRTRPRGSTVFTSLETHF